MKSSFKSCLTLLAILQCLAPAVQADVTVFVNVSVIPMTGPQVLRQQSVVVADGFITNIGHVDSVPVPKATVVIDGTDRFLIPGLAEMHAHLTSTEADQVDRLATLFVANGVTLIRGMLGHADHLALRESIESGEVFGPRLITSGPSLNGRSVSGAADAARQVREQKAAGYDFIKVHPGLSQDEFIALAQTANEIGIPFAGHVPVAAGLETALQLTMASIDHLDGYFAALLPASNPGAGGYGGFFDTMLASELDVSKIPEIVEATRVAGVWSVPTQVLVEQLIDQTPVTDLKSRPEMRYITPEVLDNWVAARARQQSETGFNADTATQAIALRRQLILQLQKAGAGLLLGSDAPQVFNVPGFSLHRELQALVAAGLTPYEALRTGTAAVADFLGSNGGVVVEGRDADLVLLDANPLLDIENSRRIHGVMLRGQWLSAAELNRRLERFDHLENL